MPGLEQLRHDLGAEELCAAQNKYVHDRLQFNREQRE
jgi:hypothetical protein